MFFNHITDITKLKQTYRTLSKIYHPDNGGDTEKFKELNEEYNNQKKFIHTGKRPITERTAPPTPPKNSQQDFVSEFMKHPLVQQYAPKIIDSISDKIKQSLMDSLSNANNGKK